MTEQTGESRDGQGSGDHNKDFEFGVPPGCRLAHWEVAGLLLLRGRVKDFTSGKPGGPADGDCGYTIERSSGLSVPLTDPTIFWKD